MMVVAIDRVKGNVSRVVVDNVQQTTGQKMNGKCWKLPPRKCSLPAAIAATTKVRAGLKWKISAMGSYQSSQKGLVGAKKYPKRQWRRGKPGE